MTDNESMGSEVSRERCVRRWVYLMLNGSQSKARLERPSFPAFGASIHPGGEQYRLRNPPRQFHFSHSHRCSFAQQAKLTAFAY